MMKDWGTRRVSSAFEVFNILVHPPRDILLRERWDELHTMEAPVWGGPAAHALADKLEERGFRVWSFDDHGVVFSWFWVTPPSGLVYRAW